MSQASDLQPTPAAQVVASNKPSKPNEMNLIWVDMEMTGLDPDNDKIIEVAVV